MAEYKFPDELEQDKQAEINETPEIEIEMM